MQVLVIGGGVSGLTSSILLARNGIEVCLVERKSYPFHRVCGEYVSNEALPFLKTIDAYPKKFNPPLIDTFLLTSINGKSHHAHLDLGGFGISRFSFDQFLSQIAVNSGVNLLTGVKVMEVELEGKQFRVILDNGKSFHPQVVIGAFGKRSLLDRKLNRKFLSKSSPYLGVKYHIKLETTENEIALHNFPGGYCGISRVENGIVNLCYLSRRDNLKSSGDIRKLEENYLMQNPFLKKIWENAEFLFEKPVVINEINFDSKSPVESHILMTGDSAGMITPLCGNGMAMGVHSAKIASEEIINFLTGASSRIQMEDRYMKRWQDQFSFRLKTGRTLQKLFGKNIISNFSVQMMNQSKSLSRYLISKTHGSEF